MNLRSAISSTDVHVWRFALLADGPTQARYGQLLAPEEQRQASRFRFERDRRRFVVRRAILRHILAAYQDRAPCGLQFTAGTCGKPEVAGTAAPGGLQFSCSHSEELGLVAVSRGRALGVDIEVHRLMDSGLMAVTGFFAPAEQDELRQAAPEHWTKAFFDYWTCKEAVVKALGLGLSFPLDRFVVSVGPGATPRLVSLDGDLTAGERWQILALDVGSDCSGTLVVAGGTAIVNARVWRPECTQ